MIIATVLALMVAKVVRVVEVDQTSVDKVLAKDKKLGGAICTPFFYIKIKSCSKSHAFVEAIPSKVHCVRRVQKIPLSQF